jgi:hypothetical protein
MLVALKRVSGILNIQSFNAVVFLLSCVTCTKGFSNIVILWPLKVIHRFEQPDLHQSVKGAVLHIVAGASQAVW